MVDGNILRQVQRAAVIPGRHQIRFSLNTSGHKSAPRALRGAARRADGNDGD